MSEEQASYQADEKTTKVLTELQGEIQSRVRSAMEEKELQFLTQPYADGKIQGLIIGYQLIERYLKTGTFRIEKSQILLS